MLFLSRWSWNGEGSDCGLQANFNDFTLEPITLGCYLQMSLPLCRSGKTFAFCFCELSSVVVGG